MLAEIFGIENEHLDPATKALIRWKLLERIEDTVSDRVFPSEKSKLETELMRRQLERTPPLNDDVTERPNPVLVAKGVQQGRQAVDRLPHLLGVKHPPEWVKASLSLSVPKTSLLADARSLYGRTSAVTGAHYAGGGEAIAEALAGHGDSLVSGVAKARAGVGVAKDVTRGVVADATRMLQNVGKQSPRLIPVLRSIL